VVAIAGYSVESVDPQIRGEDALAVWRGNLGSDAHMAAKMAWFYRSCPFGTPLLELLRHEETGQAVGAAGVGPRRMRWRGREFTAGVLVDLAINAAHRSLGPALVLHQALLGQARQHFGLVYGMPNKQAIPVFRRIGHVHLGDMVRYARVLKHEKYLGRRLPGWFSRLTGWVLDRRARFDAWRKRRSLQSTLAGSWSGRAPADADTLWATSEHGDDPIGIRDHAFLAWRFDANPLATVRFFCVRQSSDRRLRAWFACESDGDLLHVRDYWSHDAIGGVSSAYVAMLVRAAQGGPHSALSVEFAGPDDHLAGWFANAFMERSRRPVYGQWHLSGMPASQCPHLTSADEDE
jgi:hypothetical protein